MAGLKRSRLTVFGSLRAKMLATLGAGAVFALVASLMLVYGIRQANFHLERASSAQKQLESLMLLSGRVATYGLAAIVSLRTGGAEGRLEQGRDGVAAVLEGLGKLIGNEVSLQTAPRDQAVSASKSLAVARMRAQFDSLDRRMVELAREAAPGAEATERAERYLEAFGLGFSPLLAQAIEDARRAAERARIDMLTLRSGLTAFAIFWGLAAAAIAILLYGTAVRPVLSRIRQAASGARAIASGGLDTRLSVTGHDELTLLMARINRIAQNLARREALLIAGQSDLRRTVDQKTRDLSLANRRLQEIDDTRRRFFADVSHELRTPLTVILGEAEITLRQTREDCPAPVRASFEVIVARAQNLRRRVDDLLRIARSESGELNLRLQTLDLRSVVEDAVAETEGLARQRELTIAPAPMPTPLAVCGDKEWLRQVISGLIANAVKYSAPGGSIAISAYGRDGYATIDVADEGCGIAPEDLPHVFDRFYQGKRRSPGKDVGHGIGLALAKWLIESHHGTIEIQSPRPDAEGGAESPGIRVRLKIPMEKQSACLETAT